jgi:hypothetical protein
MTHGGGVVTVVAEASENRVDPVFSICESTRRHSKLYYFARKSRYKVVNVFRYKVLVVILTIV